MYTPYPLIRPGFVLWFKWVLTNILAACLGWAIAMFMGCGTLGLGLVLAGLPVGLLVGIAQANVLKRYGVAGTEWLWALLTLIGMNLGLATAVSEWPGLLNVTSPAYATHAMWHFALGGAIFGLVQLPLLWHSLRVSVLWVPISALSWTVGAVVGFRTGAIAVATFMPNYGYDGIILGPGEFLHFFVAGSVFIGICAVITGLALTWLLPTLSARYIPMSQIALREPPPVQEP